MRKQNLTEILRTNSHIHHFIHGVFGEMGLLGSNVKENDKLAAATGKKWRIAKVLTKSEMHQQISTHY
jgi:hypothetical protein